jgi:hypothetical protein
MHSLRLFLVCLAAYASMTTLVFCADLPESDTQVWKVAERRWTIQEEQKYSEWVEANISRDFFIRYKISVDCADVPYAVRWIYARISRLPAAATTVDNRLMGHWSRDWGHLPTNPIWHQDRRFRAALMAMLSKTSTRTMPSDTYPIRIGPESVTSGTVFLVSEAHAGIVRNIIMDGSSAHPVQTLEAGLPARVQKLRRRNFISPDPDPDHLSGLIKFRWPIEKGGRWHYPPVKEQPFYSREQYLPSFTEGYGDYLAAVAKRIDPNIYDPRDKMRRVINTIIHRLKERMPVVLDGFRTCHAMPCPEGSRLWEIHSTPDRDEFIQVMIDHLEDIIRENQLDRDAVLGPLAEIRLQISPDLFTDVQHVLQNSQWMSPDPEATIEARWALDKCGIIAGRLKNARESIAFIKKKYGKADPRFAERSIWTQQAIVDEMTAESQKSNCGKRPVNGENADKRVYH